MAQFGGVDLTNIVAMSDGILAVGAPYGGSAPPVQSPQQPSLWRSSNGFAWQRLPDSPAFIDPRSSWFDSISTVAPGASSLLVAVGSADLGDGSAFDAAAWTSTDCGASWQRASVDGATDAAMYGVTAGPDGYVAVGIDGHPSGGTQMIGSRGAAVWTSRDGRQWSRVPTEPAFLGAEMTEVIGGGSNLVAIGSDNPTGAIEAAPPIWHSPDGLRWTRADAIAIPGPGSIGVAAALWNGSAFVVVGGEERGDRLFAWTSPDGASWARTELKLARSGLSHLHLDDLATSGSMMVLIGFNQTTAAGTFDQEIAGTEAEVWESTDGHAWQVIPSVPLFAHAFPSRVISVPAGLVVLASTADQSNVSALWLAAR